MLKKAFQTCCLAIASSGLLMSQSVAQDNSEKRFPEESWSYYASAEQAGFIPSRLAKVEKFYDRRAFASLLIVKDGAIAVDWGESDRRFLVHSIRKSMLSALYGIHFNDIDLNLTLHDLNIDDNTSLTEIERSATLMDVLSSRSGIYLPAAAEGGQMITNKPERGSYAPGTYWVYNNWDFNVAGTIYNQLTGEAIPQAFATHIAEPLQMQDFRDFDGYSVKAESEHRADQFRMSSRDLARMGLLYARDGNWRGQQIIPQEWIDISTQAVSQTNMGNKYPPHYGYMWWVENDGSYSARGVGGHILAVYPERDMVVVLRTNTYLEHSVSARAIQKILEGIVSASEGEIDPAPTLSFKPDKSDFSEDLPVHFQHNNATIVLESGQEVTLTTNGKRLFVNLGTGQLELQYISGNQFTIIDRQEPLEILLDDDGQVTEIRTPRLFYLQAAHIAQQGNLEKAMYWVNQVVDMQPQSAMAYTNKARIYIAMEDISSAKAMLSEALKHDPNHKQANGLKQTLFVKQWMLPSVVSLILGLAVIVLYVVRKRRKN